MPVSDETTPVQRYIHCGVFIRRRKQTQATAILRPYRPRRRRKCPPTASHRLTLAVATRARYALSRAVPVRCSPSRWNPVRPHPDHEIDRRPSDMTAEERFRRKMAIQNSARQRELDRDECLAEAMDSLNGAPCEELARRVDGPIDLRRVVKNGRTYSVRINVFVDEETPGTLRIVFMVDDGGLHLTAPKEMTRFVAAGEKFAV